jgi:hypothetical protein
MATFQLVERESVMPPDVFGVWQSAPASVGAFASPGTRSDIPRWQIDADASPQETANAFLTLHASLNATDRALFAAQTRLRDFVRVQQTLPTQYSAAAFATAPQPEAALNQLLLSAQGSIAFGWTDQIGEWKQAIDEFIAFTQQIQQHVLNYALVDTRVAEARVGITRVTWGGDFESVLTTQAHAVHEAALRAMLLSRQQLLKQFATVVRGAGELAGLALIAANPALALPAALRFLKLLFDEIRKSQNA